MALPVFPVGISKGASGGPSFRVAIVEATSGQEARNRTWAKTRHFYNVSHNVKTTTQYEVLRDLWMTAGGPFSKILFKDWADYESDGQQSCDPATGDGAETEFQLQKTYATSGLTSYTRKITRPVASTVKVYVNDVLQTLTTDYTIDEDTGIVTFEAGSTPTSGHTVKAEYEFYVPVRFAMEEWPASIDSFGVFSVSGIELVEIRE